MAEKRKRGQKFTAEEKDKLVKLLKEHKKVRSDFVKKSGLSR